MGAVTTNLLDRAMAGDRSAVRELIGILMPVLQARTARVLLRRGGARRLDVKDEICDLCHDVLVKLLRKDRRLLRSWDPDRGMSFENYVGLVAEQHVAATFRKRREELWRDEAAFEELEPAVDSSRTPEQIVASREALETILDAVRADLTERGNLLFDLLFVDGRTNEDVGFIMDMEKEAVRAWRSRLGRRMASLAEEILADVPKRRAGGAS